MICPRCNTANPEGSKFCLQCGAPLASAPASPPPPPVSSPAGGAHPAAPHQVVHQRTSPTLWVFVAGVALAIIVLLAAIGAGAYHVLRGRQAAPSGPVGLQPRLPASPPTPPPPGSSGPTPPPQSRPVQPAVPTPTRPTPPPTAPAPPSSPGQPPQPAGPQVPSQPPNPVPPQAPAKAEMRLYRDPGGAFRLECPMAWKVQRNENGYTVFYQDDPEEGTLFGVFPKLVLNGQATAAQILEALKRDVRQRYPDFEVRRQRIDPVPGGELALVDARWTNGRNERMATTLTLHLTTTSDQPSDLLLVNIQAPEVAFEALLPTFQHMFNSFLDSLRR